jgi:hypothetical protein
MKLTLRGRAPNQPLCRWSGMVFFCSTLAIQALPSQLQAETASFRDFPVMIFCNYNNLEHAYYFSQLDGDGRAIYITPDRQAGSITLEGIAERIGGDRSGNCAGKTLDELRADGQAFDLTK